ncbi:hypothetical protein SAMN05216588_102263 [Pseudomonas flavescens]|uniref:FAD/FMN-containing dehydrogenase n=1 Tax=Phytopseudomonas flavescens TaxID=29435 RepID=A0A1G7ZA62_9GAMM|nr:hypothetical protein [Pseudomonas flavescens]SDH05487.1 hypothetical protein SAMN05216588_102263 [Pseudomonas flavescens]
MKCFSLLLLSIMSWSAWAADAPVNASTPWTLLDQFENPYTLDNAARVVLVARSMSTARLVNGALEEKPQGFLQERHVVYVADIEKMPSLAKMVAVPAMRSAKYRIMLDQTGRVASRYQGDRETVQWLELEDGRVIRQQRFSDAGELQRALEALPR